MRTLRRAAATTAVGLALGVSGALLLGVVGTEDDAYLVRAIFDNASFVIPGEDVKVAGVKVGAIESVELTPQRKAAVVLRIDDPAFRPFRSDAHCQIGLQSLIGEQFVQCTPTQPQAGRLPPPLPAVKRGPGTGQHLLTVDHTTTPVGVDLLNNITRQPERERLRIIINELGAGLAGNGQELRAALRRADPALQQTDRVIAVLADQNRLLARLTDESDRILAPLASERKRVGGFIEHAGKVAVAAADRGDAIEANLEKLPGFLKELRPAADRLSGLADQMTPAVQSLDAQAPAINASVKDLGPFAKASTGALVTLGNVAQRGRQTFPRIQAVARQLRDLAVPLKPLATEIAALASSFDKAGGIENVMRFIYYYTGAVNGEDRLGHYIRSSFEVSNCSARISQPAPGCPSNFDKTAEAGTRARATSSPAELAPLLDYLLAPEGTG